MAEREVSIRFSAENAAQVSGAIRTLGNEASSAARQTKELDDASRSASAGGGMFLTNLLLLPQALLSAGRLIKGLAEGIASLTIGSAVAADRMIDVRQAFERVTGGAEDAARVLQELQEATSGQIDKQSIMQTSIVALSNDIGLTSRQLAALFRGIKASSEAVGRDFQPAFQALSRALTTGNTRMLALIPGFSQINASLESAKERAKELGVAFPESAERATIIQAALDAAAGAIEKFGDGAENLADRGVRLSVVFQDIKSDILATIFTSDELSQSLDVVAKAFGITGKEGEALGIGIGEAIAGLSVKILSFGIDSVSAWRSFKAGAQDAIGAAIEAYKNIQPYTNRFIGGLQVAAGLGTQVAGAAIRIGFEDAGNAVSDFGQILIDEGIKGVEVTQEQRQAVDDLARGFREAAEESRKAELRLGEAKAALAEIRRTKETPIVVEVSPHRETGEFLARSLAGRIQAVIDSILDQGKRIEDDVLNTLAVGISGGSH